MAMKVEIISKEIIRPSSPTPDHFRNFKISFLDEVAPPSYVPILLLYSAADFSSANADFPTISEKLKNSLSETLTRFYPFCGTLKGNISVDCNDEGALYVEAKADIAMSEIVKSPETRLLNQLFALNPYRVTRSEEAVITGVQLTLFRCGSVGIGLCVSHKLVDGTTLTSFLNAWAATASGLDKTLAPRLDSATFFPPIGIDLVKQGDVSRYEEVVTRIFEFDAKNLANLKTKAGNEISPTRIEAATALIWKCSMEAMKVNSGKDALPSSVATHLVNIRGRMQPPLPEHSLGNVCRLALAPFLDVKKEVELDELVGLIRKSIRKIDAEYVSKLQGADGFAKALETFKELRGMSPEEGGGAEVYTFSSWARFPLYDINFGWGKPTKVCTVIAPIRNSVVFMSTKSGDGIEAWVALTEKDMAEFERNQELLQFVSASA